MNIETKKTKSGGDHTLNDHSLIKIKSSLNFELSNFSLGKPELYTERIDNRLACRFFSLNNLPDTCVLPCCKPFDCNHYFHAEYFSDWKN